MGGTWGLYEALRNPDGKTLKLRVNRCYLQDNLSYHHVLIVSIFLLGK